MGRSRERPTPYLQREGADIPRIIASTTIFIAFVCIAWADPSFAAPKAERWDFWDVSRATSTVTVDHSGWNRFLASYVVANHPSGINRLRYPDVTPADRQALKQYLAHLQTVKVRELRKPEQKAYWINLYNALTVDVMLDHMPVASIMDVSISPRLLSRGPWGKKLATVEGQAVSLDDIEHRILRPIFQDPRVHYAVNCASLGCPNLPTTAFMADNIDALLDQAARDYINHPRGVTIKDGRVIVSSIYSWFASDFGGDDAGVLAHLRRFAQDDLKARLAGATTIADNTYDWSLNGP